MKIELLSDFKDNWELLPLTKFKLLGRYMFWLFISGTIYLFIYELLFILNLPWSLNALEIIGGSKL